MEASGEQGAVDIAYQGIADICVAIILAFHHGSTTIETQHITVAPRGCSAIDGKLLTATKGFNKYFLQHY